MPLRAYLVILGHRWPLLLLLPLLAGGLSLALALGRAPAYLAQAQLLVTVAPPAPAALPALDDGATWTTTEYVLDDLPFVLASTAFATDVSAAMAAAGYPAEVAAIRAGLRPEVTHRSVTLSATAATPEQAAAMLRGAIETLQQGGLKYWGRAPSGGLEVAVLDPPGPAALVGGLRVIAREVGLRMALAFVAAVGLAFLAHALDDRLRTAAQAEEWLGAQVLAVIPKES
jgi:hypothetical protein